MAPFAKDVRMRKDPGFTHSLLRLLLAISDDTSLI
jgi:hypothetical protein